jgi:hypothetical protein
LSDGTVVNPNGTYVKNRVRQRLQDGECLDMNGNKYANEYQYRNQVKKENQGLTQAQMQERNQNRYQLMMIDGEMYQIRNQEQYRIRNQVNLADGTAVNPDGTYIRERQQLRLQDGECINMDGQLYQNTYQHRKMVVQKNKTANKKALKKRNKPANKTKAQKKNMKKGIS